MAYQRIHSHPGRGPAQAGLQRAHQQDQARRRRRSTGPCPALRRLTASCRPPPDSGCLCQGLGQEEALATRRENSGLQDEGGRPTRDQAGYPRRLGGDSLTVPRNDSGLVGRGHVRLPEGICAARADRGALLPAGPGGSVLRHLPPDYYDRQTWPEFHRSPPGEHGVYLLLLPQLRGEL